MTTFRTFVAGLSTEARELVSAASAGGRLPVERVTSVDIRTKDVLIENGLLEVSDALGIRAWRLTTFGQIVRVELEAAQDPGRLLSRSVLYAHDARALYRDRAVAGDDAAEVLEENVAAHALPLAELVGRIDDGRV